MKSSTYKFNVSEMAEHIVFGTHVIVPGLGTFVTKTVAARMARNPKTGEPVYVPAKRRIKFTPAKSLTASLNSD